MDKKAANDPALLIWPVEVAKQLALADRSIKNVYARVMSAKSLLGDQHTIASAIKNLQKAKRLIEKNAK